MTAARDQERRNRAAEAPIVGGLPDFPGILAAIMISPRLGGPLRALADFLLVEDYPGATLSRADREMIATAVSAGNDCFYCMDTHAAFAAALLQKERGLTADRSEGVADALKSGRYGSEVLPKCSA